MDRHTTPLATAQPGIAHWNYSDGDKIGPALDAAVDGKVQGKIWIYALE